MTTLLLNRRRFFSSLPRWFPDGRDDLVVLTAARALEGRDPAMVAADFRHLEVVDDYESPEVEELAERLCKDFRVRRILTTAEIDLMRAGRLRDKLGLPGQDERSASAYRDKYVMKSTAQAAGIPVAPMRVVSNGEELADFARSHGYPVVLKRLTGAACIGMSVIENARALPTVTQGWDAAGGQPMLAEGWIDGEILHVDGLIDGGQVIQSWPSTYLYPNWQTKRRQVVCASSMLPEDHPLYAPLQEITAQVVGALPPTPGIHPLHAEFFHTPGGQLVLCEVACRAGGCGVVEAHEASFGVNLYEAGLRGQQGRSTEVTFRGMTRRHGWAWFPPQSGFLRRRPDTCPLPNVVRYQATGAAGRHYLEPRSAVDSIAEMVLSLSAADPLAELREAESWWNDNVEWSDVSTTDRGEGIPDVA